jgi:hypothetical protein
MVDTIFKGWLERQYEAAMGLVAESDMLMLRPVGPSPFTQYLVRLSCLGLRKPPGSDVVEAGGFHVAIRFGDDHLRRLVDPMRVVTLLSPPHVFHPNIMFPAICLGNIVPGVGLVDLLYQVWEVLTYRRVVMREDDALNAEACRWARRNQHRFPIDERPLKRITRRFEIHARSVGASPC